VLFVNVPIGVAAALAAPRVLRESRRQRGRFDLPGAVTGTGGLAALVYGLSKAATSPDGVSHWGDSKVVASLAASAVLLAAFAVIETRSSHALLPLRLLADRDRTGANLIMLCLGASLRNTGQQVGGSIGLAMFGTVAWTVVANSIHVQVARAATIAAQAGHPAHPSQAALTAIYHHALAAGFSRAFLVAAGVMVLGLIITIVAIRVRRADLAGASPF
jgi:hypothetical protein